MTDHILDEAIILAGGLGTRLRSVTESPKILAEICNRPFIEYLLDHLIENGLKRIVFAVGYKHELIIKHFENGYRGLDIDFAIEKESLGTGGAIVNALSRAKNQKVLILNGDVYCSFNASELISDSDLLITAIEVDDMSRYGSLEIKEDNLISFLEKGSNGKGYINAGIYFADKKAFQDYPLGYKFSFELDFIPVFLKNNKVKIKCIQNKIFIDIGTPEDYKKAQILLAENL